jgi:hypothetical protein
MPPSTPRTSAARQRSITLSSSATAGDLASNGVATSGSSGAPSWRWIAAFRPACPNAGWPNTSGSPS